MTMQVSDEGQSDTLYFVRWKDEAGKTATYGCGPQANGRYPAGVIGFVSEEDAQPYADAVNGWVVPRALAVAIARAQELQVPLYIRTTDKHTFVVEETVPGDPEAAGAATRSMVVTCSDDERAALVEVATDPYMLMLAPESVEPGIPLVEGRQYLAYWFMNFFLGDWMMCAWRVDGEEGQPVHFRGRVRYRVDDQVWETDDVKQWFEGYIGNCPEDAQAVEFLNLSQRDFVRDCVIASARESELAATDADLFEYDECIIINGDHMAVAEALRDRPWANWRQAEGKEVDAIMEQMRERDPETYERVRRMREEADAAES